MSALPTLVIGAFRSEFAFLQRSLRPGCVVFCAQRERIAFAGARIDASPKTSRGLAAVIAARGRILENDEIVEAVWGDDLDGGPLLTRESLGVLKHKMRAAAASFGVTIETEWGRGIAAMLSSERRAA